jgi:hypothetical protein
MKQFHTAALTFATLFNSILCVGAQPAARPLIIPAPHEITNSGKAFVLNEQVTIGVPDRPSSEDLFLARMLADELGDRFGLHLKTERMRNLDGGRPTIVIGVVTNPLVGKYCGTHVISLSMGYPGPDAYVLQANERVLLVAGSDDRGAFYGLQSLQQLITKNGGSLRVQGVSRFTVSQADRRLSASIWRNHLLRYRHATRESYGDAACKIQLYACGSDLVFA